MLAGIHRSGGRERLVMSFAFNYNQQQFRLLAHGVVDWLTHGVHLGYWRNYLTVHVDDLFAADARWSAAAKCTPGEGDCPPGTPDTTPIRMTAADVSRAVAVAAAATASPSTCSTTPPAATRPIADTGSDALTTAMLAAKNDFRWLNHTYTHAFLGCEQDFTVIPWRCATDPGTGQPVYASRATDRRRDREEHRAGPPRTA